MQGKKVLRYLTKFECPQEHGVMRDACLAMIGEYDIPGIMPPYGATVLDIGANIGGFVRWAQFRYPGCKVIAYEPNPQNCRYLHINCADFEVVQAAVTIKEAPVKLYISDQNCCQHSLIEPKSHAGYVEVKTVHPKDLPECTVLKIDTEGCELEILTNYLPKHKPELLMIEAHGEKDRYEIDALVRTDYILASGRILNYGLAVLGYIRRDLIKNKASQSK